MIIETSQLQTLMAISTTGSFSKAALKLNVTQSAISQSIKNLEKKVGVQLLKRSGKKIFFTEEGKKLYLFAHQFLGKMDVTLNSISSSRDTMDGRVRIGTLSGIGKSWLAHEVLELLNTYPQLNCDIELGFQESLVKDFNDNKLDILILPEGSLPPNGVKKFLSKENSTLIYPKSMAEEIYKISSVEDLSQMPTILFENEDPLYVNWCQEYFGEAPNNTNIRFVINSHGNMLQAVSEGLGVAVIPNHVLIRSHLLSEVGVFSVEKEISNGNFYIVHHEEAKDLKRINTTIDCLLKSKNPIGLNLIQ